MRDTFEIFVGYPLLIPNFDFTKWVGYITSPNENEVTVAISCPDFPHLYRTHVKLVSLSGYIPSDYEEVVQKILERSKSFLNFLQELKAYIVSLPPNKLSASNVNIQNPIKSTYYKLASVILSEVESKIGPKNVVSLAGDLSKITFCQHDEKDRRHVLELKIPHNYSKSSAEILTVDLPEAVMSKFSKLHLISDYYGVFQEVVFSLQDFWDAFIELQVGANVLEPKVPRYETTAWRIMIAEGVHAQIILNPLDMKSCPEIHIFGTKSGSLFFQGTLENSLKENAWNADKSLLSNLCDMLQLTSLPPPVEESDDADFQLVSAQECSICFEVKSEENCAPMKYCSNDKCNVLFHFQCLLQWFQSLPTHETADSSYISGDCLNCGTKILCPITSK